MRDDCIEAQRIVSETYDGAEIPAAEIQQAREHCEGCPECASFVSVLASVRRLPAPSAPPAVVETSIRALRKEKLADDAARQAAEAVAAHEAAAASLAPDEGTPRPDADAGEISRWPKWAVYTSWATAAAATVVVAGIVTMQGAQFIAGTNEAATDDAGYRLASPQSAEVAEESDSSLDAAATADQADVSYITVGDWVYDLVGPETTQPSNSTTIATTTSALDTSNAPERLNVFSIGSQDEIVVGTDERLLRFRLVSRTFRGVRYGMKSRAISSFGQWPALPDGMPEPISEDGKPYFTRDVSDDLGVPMYVPEDSRPEDGFAVPPDTASGDPAAGNPNWTWWERP